MKSETKEFSEEQKNNCSNATKYIEKMLGIKNRCYPTIEYGVLNNKFIRIEIIINETDYKKLDIKFSSIVSKMNDGDTFEKAVYELLVNTMTFEPDLLTEYRANIYEKLLSNYLCNSDINLKKAGYFIHPDQYLCYSGEINSDKYQVIAYMEDIASITFSDNLVTINIKDGSDDDKDIRGYELGDEGWRKIDSDGKKGKLNVIEPEPKQEIFSLNELAKGSKEQYKKAGFPFGDTEEGFKKWQDKRKVLTTYRIMEYSEKNPINLLPNFNTYTPSIRNK